MYPLYHRAATDRRVLLMELIAPGATGGAIPASPIINRQVVYQVAAPEAGRYTLRVANLGREDVVRIDVSAADVQVTAPL